jgi:hypothetical protein
LIFLAEKSGFDQVVKGIAGVCIATAYLGSSDLELAEGDKPVFLQSMNVVHDPALGQLTCH